MRAASYQIVRNLERQILPVFCGRNASARRQALTGKTVCRRIAGGAPTTTDIAVGTASHSIAGPALSGRSPRTELAVDASKSVKSKGNGGRMMRATRPSKSLPRCLREILAGITEYDRRPRIRGIVSAMPRLFRLPSLSAHLSTQTRLVAQFSLAKGPGIAYCFLSARCEGDEPIPDSSMVERAAVNR